MLHPQTMPCLGQPRCQNETSPKNSGAVKLINLACYTEHIRGRNEKEAVLEERTNLSLEWLSEWDEVEEGG